MRKAYKEKLEKLAKERHGKTFENCNWCEKDVIKFIIRERIK
jgi:hypothetical protein